MKPLHEGATYMTLGLTFHKMKTVGKLIHRLLWTSNFHYFLLRSPALDIADGYVKYVYIRILNPVPSRCLIILSYYLRLYLPNVSFPVDMSLSFLL
jgi:hypothetical protein